jgi:transposase-like protein
MANQLKMAEIQAVTALLQQGWSQRRIARELGLDRETVARYAHRWQEAASKPANLRPGSDADVEAKPANLRLGSEEAGEAKPAILRPGSEPVAEAQDPLLAGLPAGELMAPSCASAGEHSACGPFREVIQRKVDQALSAQRIWQDLRVSSALKA